MKIIKLAGNEIIAKKLTPRWDYDKIEMIERKT
jgi:hypothetical protein